MKKFTTHLTFVLVLLIALCAHPKPSHAAIYSYKLFDPMSVPEPVQIGIGRVTWWNELSEWPLYRGGTMILSRNPDGTGDARVGDTLQLQISNQYHGIYTYSYDAHRPNCFNEQSPPMPPQDITSYFTQVGEPNQTVVRILDWCGAAKQTDSLYLVNITPDSTPTPTVAPAGPTPTITPEPPNKLPEGAHPFLDLPWDYRSRGMTFTDAVLKMSSYFDHQYPILSAIGMTEPTNARNTTVAYDSTIQDLDISYSSHDGYDYAYDAQVLYGDRVLAAAEGDASYVNTCPGCGNMIVIDHHNGYQTRYMHMQKDGLIIAIPGLSVHVTQGQPIGLVGYSGNVMPHGKLGSHLHFMVVEDKNHDGDFEDNIPDGVTDPMGWEPATQDPWSAYQFTFKGASRVGNSSHYMWNEAIDHDVAAISARDGGVARASRYTVTFPAETSDRDYMVNLQPTSHITLEQSLTAVVNAFILSAHTYDHVAMTQFGQAFSIVVKFNPSDLMNIDPSSLSIYSSEDGAHWHQENTSLDMSSGYATTSVGHMSYFVLAGHRVDTTAPVTSMAQQGTTVTLNAHDEGGSHVSYVAYQIDEGEVQEYRGPFEVTGTHTLRWYSQDSAGNVESTHQVSLTGVVPTPTKIPTPSKALSVTPTGAPTPTQVPGGPEIDVTYDHGHHEIEYHGVGRGAHHLKKVKIGDHRYRVTDESNGHTAAVDIDEDVTRDHCHITVLQVQYDGGHWTRVNTEYDGVRLVNHKHQLHIVTNHSKIVVSSS